jgi:lipopolysaccharide transport system ATP-binding protein
MTTVISVENLSKVYRLGQIGTGTFSYDLKLWWAKTRGKPNPLLRIGETDHGNRVGEDLWALKDVSFSVKQGEVLGIIGKNGAGKSTLLKILSRVTAPTSGRVKVKGRIASLLEVGTGFHPELTGRENTYLNGAILGMSRQEIDRKFDEIVDFSGVEKFIDTPVKRYSSGMYVRLAFAVAAHLDPEILVVDEVLAVGDAEFQKKCLGKMDEVAKEGRTVLFVSHNMGAITSLTSKCMCMKHGEVFLFGSTTEVVSQYLSGAFGTSKTNHLNLEDYHRKSTGEAPVCFTHIWINEAKDEILGLSMGESFILQAEVDSLTEIRDAYLSLVIKRGDGLEIARILTADQDIRYSSPPGRHTITCEVRDLPLAPGNYLINMGISQTPESRAWDLVKDYPLFRVEDRDGKALFVPNRRWGIVHWEKVIWNLPN